MKELTAKRFIFWNLFFAVVLLLLFREFFFQQDTLLVTSDHLNSLGMRFVREGFFLTHWAPARLGGIPTLEATFGDSYHPLVLFHSIFNPARALGYKFIFTIFLSFTGGLFLFNYLSKDSRFAGLIAMLYALSPQLFSLVYPGHDAKLSVIAALPFAFYGYLQFIQKNKRWGLLVLWGAVAWMITGSHLQMAYFSLWGIGFHTLLTNFKSFKDLRNPKCWKRQGLLAIALTVALGTSMVQLYPPYQYTTQDSVRGTEEKTSMAHAVSWSIHPEEAMSLALPNFIGSLPTTNKDGQRQETYWGRNAFKLNSDAVGTMLWIVGIWGIVAIGIRNRESLFWITVVTISIIYALGIHTGLFGFFYHLIPGVQNFRAPSMGLYWVPFALAYVGALGLPKYWETDSVWKKRLPIVMASFLSVMFLMLKAWPILVEGPGAVIVLIVMVLVNFALLQDNREKWSWKITFSRWKSNGVAGVFNELTTLFVWNLPLIVLILMFINSSAIKAPEIAAYFKPLNNVVHGQVSGSVIVHLVVGLGVIGSFFFAQKMTVGKGLMTMGIVGFVELVMILNPYIQTVELRDYVNPKHRLMAPIISAMPDKLNDYRVLTFMNDPALKPNAMPIFGLRHGAGFHDNEIATYQEFRGGSQSRNYTQTLQNNPYLDIANIGFVLYADQQGQPQYYQNPTAFPRVKLFGNVEQVADPIISLRTRRDHSTNLLFEEGELKSSTAPVTGTASIVEIDEGDDIFVDVNASTGATLLFTENFHKYWKATVNGVETPIVRAFGSFQAISVPAGESKVHFQYRSEAVAVAAKAVYASLVAIILMTIWCFVPRKED